MQPDTVIPDPANPQAWNRYSYANENPIALKDPSGHIPECDKDDWACQYHWDEPITYDDSEYEISNEAVWKVVPTAVAVNVAWYQQFGIAIEKNGAFEGQGVYNLRTNEFDFLVVDAMTKDNGYLHVGMPTLWGFGGYVGFTTYKGASSNAQLLGKSNVAGADIQVDAVGKVGLTKAAGYAVKPNSIIMPAIDPVLQMPITFSQVNLTLGMNLLPDGVDGGVFIGQTETSWWTWWK